MILSDREIRAALARHAIRITPDPTLDPTLWSSTALDLHLGDHVSGEKHHEVRKGGNMIKILCEQVSPGLREADAILTFLDFNGRRHFLQIEKDFLVRHNGNSYLPVGFVHRDAQTGAFLVELPHEAETGVNRLWLRAEKVLDADEVPT